MRTVLITGGNTGIGKATVAGLAHMGWRVIFTARNKEKADAVKKEITDLTKNQNVDYLLADLTSIRQVNECAEAFKNKFQYLDVLINNAGVCLPERRITPDGMEETFQINHLSHFILTNLLIDHLKYSDDPRIINVSSAAHAAGRFDPDNLQSEKHYSSFRTYADTKLYNILFTLELAARLEASGIKANALHPGVVSTNFGHDLGGAFNFVYNIGRIIMISPAKGAATSIYLASSDEISNATGKYFVRCRPVRLNNPYLTEVNRKLLWQKSMELADLNVY